MDATIKIEIHRPTGGDVVTLPAGTRLEVFGFQAGRDYDAWTGVCGLGQSLAVTPRGGYLEIYAEAIHGC